MEAARIFSSPALRFADAGVHNRSRKFRQLGMVNYGVSSKSRDDMGILSRGFSDAGHMQYYASPSMGGGKKQKEKSDEIKTEKTKKMKLKLIKRLSKDLDFFDHMVHVEESGSILMDEVKRKTISVILFFPFSSKDLRKNSKPDTNIFMINFHFFMLVLLIVVFNLLLLSTNVIASPMQESMEVLLAELRHLRSEQKEEKRKRKEEKAQRKATLVKAKAKIDSGSSSSSSSSSSESSDSDCEVVTDMSRFRSNALNQFIDRKTEQEQENNKEEEKLADSSLSNQEEHPIISLQNLPEDCSNDHESSCTASGRRIEICMGGKCKKMGALALLEEFERKVGKEGNVMGCKCMGKCKNGPNVRIQNESAKASVEALINPLSLCIGVGLEDVDAIVRNLLGKDRNDNCIMASS